MSSKVFEINDGIRFVELSLVSNPLPENRIKALWFRSKRLNYPTVNSGGDYFEDTSDMDNYQDLTRTIKT